MEERRVSNKEEKRVNEGHSLINEVPLYFSIYRFVRDIATITLLRNRVQFDFCYWSGHVCSDDGQQHHCHSVVNCSEQTEHLLNALLVITVFWELQSSVWIFHLFNILKQYGIDSYT